MPLIIAFVVGLGSFFGYVANDKKVPQDAAHYLAQPVKHHNKPLFEIGGR